MSTFYEYEVRLSGLDMDGRGHCKASALLNHLQNAATLAAEDGGFSREVLVERYGAFWMLARSWYRLSRPLAFEDKLTIRTWHRGSRGALMYRDYDILANGQPVGESVSAWVLASLQGHKLLRLGAIAELAETGGGALCKTMTLAKLHQPEGLRHKENRLMRYSDTDLNGHVNNTRYADFACDALELEGCRRTASWPRCRSAIWPSAAPGTVWTSRWGGRGTAAMCAAWTRAANPALSPPCFSANCFLDSSRSVELQYI